jgi:hypothetical protein
MNVDGPWSATGRLLGGLAAGFVGTARCSAARTRRNFVRGFAVVAATTTVLLTSVVLVLVGIAGASAALWNGPQWTGFLAAGALGIAVASIVLRRRGPATAARGAVDGASAEARRPATDRELSRGLDRPARNGRQVWLALLCDIAAAATAGSARKRSA